MDGTVAECELENMQFPLMVIMRTFHLLAGSVWIGGSLLYVVVIGPAARVGVLPSALSSLVSRQFRLLVQVSSSVLLFTGVYLVFDRLASNTVGVEYVVVLAVKITLAVVMMLLAAFQMQEAKRRPDRRSRLWNITPRLILALGIATFALGAALTGIFEMGLTK